MVALVVVFAEVVGAGGRDIVLPVADEVVGAGGLDIVEPLTDDDDLLVVEDDDLLVVEAEIVVTVVEVDVDDSKVNDGVGEQVPCILRVKLT